MKTIFFIIFLTIFNMSAFSQLDLIGSFNSVYIGRNVTISLKRDLKNHSFLLGVKYNINREVHDNQNNFFTKRFYATNFVEHFGFDLGYQYNFSLKSSPVKPFAFYDLQITNSHTRNLMFLPYGFIPNGQFVYKRILDYFGPTIALEHNIGIGTQVNLTRRLFLHQKIGVGIVNLINIDKRILGARNWEFGSIISVGLGYKFKN